MNNLASLKSQLLLEYTEQTQSHWRTRNFYEHHTLQPRTRTNIRSSEARNKPNQTTRLNFIIPQETSASSKALLQPSSLPLGRNLFANPEKEKVPGPGTYQSPLRRYSSCYIKKEENHLLQKIVRKLRRRQIVNQCRGPGLYNPEKAFNHTSRSHSVKQAKMLPGSFSRTVVPQKKEGSLYLASTLSQLKLPSKCQPAPTSYDIQRNGFKTSNFANLPVHKMSTTQRSSIAKIDSPQSLDQAFMIGARHTPAGEVRDKRQSRPSSSSLYTDILVDHRIVINIRGF